MREGLEVRSPRVGDWVEVRSLAEIERTLNARSELDWMPFMPDMAKFSCRRFRISAVAHKTCDTVNKTGGRAVVDALEQSRMQRSQHEALALVGALAAIERPAERSQFLAQACAAALAWSI